MTDIREIKAYEFNGKILGRVYEARYEFPQGEFGQRVVIKSAREFSPEPGINEFDVIEMVEELTPSERVHLRVSAYPLYRLFEHFGINPDDYVSDEDILIHTADRGLTNLTDLNREDHRAWELVKQRGLEKRLFKGLH